MKRYLSVLLLAATPAVAEEVKPGDWPMWGGTADRNMVSEMIGLPTDWDIETGRNIKWVADLGSQSYGNPVVAGGMVFVGTNNELLRDPDQPRLRHTGYIPTFAKKMIEKGIITVDAFL